MYCKTRALCPFRLSKQPESVYVVPGPYLESKLFTFNILDRVGGGDAFASGFIYAMMHDYKAMDMLNFAVASSVIKHTIRGDANITDDVRAIQEIMDLSFDIKR